MVIKNYQNLPEALVKAVTLGKHNNPGCLSVTTLLNSTKQILLTDRHWDSLEDDVANRVWAILGTTAHKLFEHEGENEFAEEFISYDFEGVKITGRIDLYNMAEGVVTDYKTNSAWKIKFQDFKDWDRQGMIYAWLLMKNNFKVNKCRFISLIKDHSKRDAKFDPSYPKHPIFTYEFDVTPERLEEIEFFIRDRVLLYKQYLDAPDDDIPPCGADERWEKPTKYAVKKDGQKRAVRVFDTLKDAEKMMTDLGKGHFVEHRPGESTRCMDYCLCWQYCNFYRDNVAPSIIEQASA